MTGTTAPPGLLSCRYRACTLAVSGFLTTGIIGTVLAGGWASRCGPTPALFAGRLATDAPVPVPRPLEVLVRVRACTVCNCGDLTYDHYYGLREHCAQGCYGHAADHRLRRIRAGA
ncbi:hypothetical protein ACFQ7F_07185 [Streptomyces sp. NPDC056486]|uniref:hypothetical protein n=1 Tax=Streptomyces sp. NPDC056486 TaxID=3345835 RepID=UPI0036882548